jgi:hypothetical protein
MPTTEAEDTLCDFHNRYYAKYWRKFAPKAHFDRKAVAGSEVSAGLSNT